MDKYQSYIEIDLNRLENNFKEIKKISGASKVAAVLKANGYGLGAVTLSKELEKLGIDYICVSSLNEAMELRAEYIYKPILVLGYVKEDMFDILVQNRIDATIYNFDQCYKLNEAAKKLNTVVDIHVKIDTGMGRLGFLIDDENMDSTIENIIKIYNLSNVHLKGIFTHLSDADGYEKGFTKGQYEKFNNVIDILKENNVEIPIKHIANDAGSIVFDYNMDMIRMGIGLYGYYSAPIVKRASNINIEEIASFFTTVSNVKYLDKDETIGYNRTFITEKKTKIATIAIGYADGYPYSLSNKGYVLIKGKKAKILGKVCMDQTMVDISDIEDVKIGDAVLLYGHDKDNYLPIYDVADKANTIIYDLICRLSMRVPRIYIRDGEVVKVVNYLEH